MVKVMSTSVHPEWRRPLLKPYIRWGTLGFCCIVNNSILLLKRRAEERMRGGKVKRSGETKGNCCWMSMEGSGSEGW